MVEDRFRKRTRILFIGRRSMSVGVKSILWVSVVVGDLDSWTGVRVSRRGGVDSGSTFAGTVREVGPR